MNNKEMKSILDQINNLKSPSIKQKTGCTDNKILKNHRLDNIISIIEYFALAFIQCVLIQGI